MAVKIIVITILLLGALWLFITIEPILTALIMAGLLAYLLNPITQVLTRRTCLSQPAAARLVFVSFLLLLAALSAILGTVVFDQFHRMEAEFLQAIAALEKWISQPVVLLGYHIYPKIIVENLEQAAGGALASIPVESLSILSNVTSNLLWGLLLIFSLFYLLQDGHKIIPWLTQLWPTEFQPDIRRLFDEMDKVWGVFLRVQLLMFLILGFLMGAGFLLVIWLFRSGLIPFSPLMLIALLVLVVTLAQQVDNLWLRPQLMGKSLRLHPGLAFVGLTGALMVGGLLAAFFVVPLMAITKILGRYIYCRLFDLPPWQEDKIDSQEASSEPASLNETEFRLLNGS